MACPTLGVGREHLQLLSDTSVRWEQPQARPADLSAMPPRQIRLINPNCVPGFLNVMIHGWSSLRLSTTRFGHTSSIVCHTRARRRRPTPATNARSRPRRRAVRRPACPAAYSMAAGTFRLFGIWI
jgi:hypothetical protein